jgi:para-aminobenzoate synthetase component 1
MTELSAIAFQQRLRAFMQSGDPFMVLRNGPNGFPVLATGEIQLHQNTADLKYENAYLLLSYDLKNTIEKLQTTSSDPFETPAIVRLLPNEEWFTKDWKSIFEGDVDEKLEVEILPRQSKSSYLESVSALQEHIRLGDIYEVNYCTEFFAHTKVEDVFGLFMRLMRNSDAPFSGAFGMQGDFLLCGSPERFLQKTSTRLLSQPIKGTAPRGKTDSEDVQIIEALRSNTKELSENVMIVDLVRNDLSRLAKTGTVKVDELCGIYSFPTVHQMISTVSCEVKEGIGLHDIIRATFPMGSMTGAPKKRAMELIDQYEHFARGWYSGSMGYVRSNGDFDLNVIIRSIRYKHRNHYLSYAVGSAITAASIPEKEYEECLLKALTMERAIHG